ncbi:MAG: peptidase domain-containing ABC transporter [Aureliella sp.]
METAGEAAVVAGESTEALVDLPAVEGAASILGQLLHDAGYAVDRGQLRRVIGEAAETYRGPASELWWRWIGEATVELGLKCKVADCTWEEFRTLARAGAWLIVHTSGEEAWHAVTGSRGRKFRLANAVSEQPSRWGDERTLRERLGSPSAQTVLRCAIIEPAAAIDAPVEHGHASHAPSAHQPGDHGHHGLMSPLARLWGLLQPERSDIFIIGVFAFVVGLLALAIPIATQSLIDAVAFAGLLQPVVVLTLMLLAFLSFSAAVRAVEYFVIEVLQCRLFARITADLSYRLPRLRAESRDEHFMPELVNRFFDIVTVQKVTSKLLLDGLSLLLNSAIGMIVLGMYHPWLLGFDVVLLALLAFTIFILGRGAVASSIKESKQKYAAAAWLQDVARCQLAFKHDGAGQFALERGDQMVSEYLLARKKHFRILMRQMIFALAVQAVASAVLLGVGGWLVVIGQLTLGQLVAAELIVTVIVSSFAKLGYYMEIFYDLLAAVDKVGALLDLPIEPQEGMLHEFPLRPLSLKVHNAAGSAADHSSGQEPIDCEIVAGETAALLGASSRQVFDWAFGLRSPAAGHVSIDGMDPRDVRLDFLRHRVALVRDNEVFSGSVLENVHLGRPDVSSHAVRDALEQVGLLDAISQLPEGLETELASDGAPLDDAQLRRLMLARAIVGRPGLLMVDSTLDALSDEEGSALMRMLCDRRQPWTLAIRTERTVLQQQCQRSIAVPQVPALAGNASRRDGRSGGDGSGGDGSSGEFQ